MPAITLSGIHIYPVKSCAGIALERCDLEPMGLHYDRRWMVVDRNGNFVTQRTHPQLALVQPQIDNGRLVLTTFGMGDHAVPNPSRQRLRVTIWADRVNAVHVDPASDRWLSQAIGEECRLVYIPDDEIRHCDRRYAMPGDRTGFADAFPLLLISQASLDDLNRRLARPVDMRRFRPNLVVAGTEPYAEDHWRRMRVGEIKMRMVKRCARCSIPNVDPDNGIISGLEPLKTLATYRQEGKKIWFGKNVAHEHKGLVRRGDVIQIL